MGQIGVLVQPSTSRLNDKLVNTLLMRSLPGSRICSAGTGKGKRKCIEVI